MSTRTTIASGPFWDLLHETLGEEVVLEVDNTEVTLSADGNHSHASVALPASLLDAIAAAHADKKFPHQQ